jgi:hypothetical protein
MSDWKAEWQDVVDAVGRDFGDGKVRYGPDVIERGGVRRYCEPLEFGCDLHHDPEAARAAGYPDVIAPYTASLSWSIAAMWKPGDGPLFTNADRDAQPARSPINNAGFPLGPRTSGFFATDMEFDFVRPLAVGERIGSRGRRLVSCVPKETAVGRGAFLVWETEMVDDNAEVVVRMRSGTYAYQPHAAPEPGGTPAAADGSTR